MNLATIIKKPVITEKTLLLAGKGKFTFVVDTRASKHQIKQAVEDTWGVNVVSVNTVTLKGKEYRINRTRKTAYKSPSKKAIVELESGQSIDLFDITEE